MGKYSKIIDGLAGGPKAQGEAYYVAEEALVKADRRAFRPLVRALAQHPDAVAREVVAEILGQRGDVTAIPYLLKAVVDPDECVRMDAIWSIERILHFSPGGLQHLLDLSYDDPRRSKATITRFLQLIGPYLVNLE
ncbi:MAG: HEAT repeat domain-containing protein [Candidatus Hydrogenedentes bacterium]|nr:HEAT repeat domain-containing protein [Candidatus Hydrogenedentota bacterium]